MKVLIADDDATYRRLLTTILVSKQHQTVEASDGQMAWEIMQQDPVPFVITDWMMPVMDGPELIHRIRSAKFPSYTYIVLLTGRNARSDVVNGLEAGADDYLTKPFDLDELRARVAIGERILELESKLRAMNDQLQELATHDSLTGMFNRRALYECADHELARAERNEQLVSLIMMDLDYFKNVNDRFGHLVGDKALCLTADTIKFCVRSYDHAGRWGGEEFLLVLPGTELDEAAIVAERLRYSISVANLELKNGTVVSLRASFGVTSTQQGELNFEKLIQHADEALYRAKREGRNRVCVYTPQDSKDSVGLQAD